MDPARRQQPIWYVFFFFFFGARKIFKSKWWRGDGNDGLFRHRFSCNLKTIRTPPFFFFIFLFSVHLYDVLLSLFIFSSSTPEHLSLLLSAVRQFAWASRWELNVAIPPPPTHLYSFYSPSTMTSFHTQVRQIYNRGKKQKQLLISIIVLHKLSREIERLP